MCIELTYIETMDEQIILKDFVCMTEDEIINISRELARLYFSFDAEHCKVYRFNDRIYFTGMGKNSFYKKGEVISRKNFDEFVEICRKSGERLRKIREVIEGYKEKTIII